MKTTGRILSFVLVELKHWSVNLSKCIKCSGII